MSIVPLPRLLVIVALLCACLVPLTGALADNWDDCESKQADQAIRGCTAIIKDGNWKKEDLAAAHYFRGSAYRKKDDLDGAISDYTQSIALQPNDTTYYFSRGLAYEKKGDLDGAIADFNQVIKLDPSHPNAFKWRDIALRRKGESGRAAVAPSPAPAAPVRRAAPTPTYTAPPVRRAAPAPPPPVNLAFPLQSELKRLGCLTGRVDGVWGSGSRAALRRFANQAGLRLGSEPSQNALDEAKNTDSRYCTPVRAAPKRKKPKKKTVRQLPRCANAVNAICEDVAHKQCQQHSDSDRKYGACVDRAEASCARSNGCR